MPFCTNCGKELSAGAKFCSDCGAAIDATNAPKRISFYDGEIHKCPSCGELIGSFEKNCKSCGFELRSIQGASTVKDLEKRILEIEESRTEEGISKRKVLEKKVHLIRNYAIPNTKEDILEFLIMALSNIDMRVYGIDGDSLSTTEESLSYAWLAKSEQAYEKARVLFRNDPEFIEISKMYEKKMKRISRAKFNTVVLIALSIIGPIAFFLVLYFLGLFE